MTLPLIVVIVLLLASFVFTFLGARTWHWGYVLLVEAIFLASVGFFLLASETLRINAVLRSQVKTQQKQVDEARAEVEGLERGTIDGAVLGRLQNSDPPTKMAENAESIESLENLNHELLIATRLRGRVWRNVMPAGVDPKTGAVRVNFVAPAPVAPPADADADAGAPPAAAPAPAPAAVVPGIKPETVVYVFEDGAPQSPGANGAPRGPQFLGEFHVTQAAGQTATLQPAQPFEPNDFEFRRLAASRGPWIVYDTMPMDRYDIFAGLNEEMLKQLLPKQAVDEYLKHGKEATADDDPWRKVGFDENGTLLPPDQLDKAVKTLYQRRLRDYAAEFDEFVRRRVAMLAEIDALKKDIEQLTAAQEVAKKLQASRTEERQKLTADLAGIKKERMAIEKHLAEVEKLLAKARQLTADMLAKNRQLSAELTARQLPTRPANGGSGTPTKSSGSLALGAK